MKVTKTVKFEMAHRLARHTGRCFNLHGHSYVVDISVSGRNTNDGMVLDFGIIKQIWEPLDRMFDHSTMLEDCKENEELIKLLKNMGLNVNVVNFNPTAENMSVWFKELLQQKLDEYTIAHNMDELCISKVAVHETVGAVAEA